MGSKAILVVWLALLAVVLLLSSEVAAARDLAETTKTTHQSSETANKLEDAKYGGYPGGGYPGHGGGGYPGHGGGGGGYPGHGGGGGGYPGHGGGGGCHYGCCGHGYYGHCKCCASADEAAAQAAATTQP